MAMQLDGETIQKIQNATGFPWWNGAAYAEYKGYPQRVQQLEGPLGEAIDDLHDVLDWLREEKQYEKADRLRTIIGRMARALNSDHDGALRTIAKGYK